VLVWGNGGCGGDGNANSKFLSVVASYGYLAIASGRPGGSGGTTSAMMKQSIDFAVKYAGQGKYANVDATKIMAAGFSCGGVEAMDMSWDSRVTTIGVFSSGLLTNYTAASKFTKPVLYAIGGSGDVAYQNVSPSPCARLPAIHGQALTRSV
jgi:dienelactone hydrolase